MPIPDPALRHEFETSMLFAPMTLRVGFFLRKADGTYRMREAEHMFFGYCVARAEDAQRLKRFDPGRPIPHFLLNQINEQIVQRGRPHITTEAIRIILATIGGTPT